MSNFDYYAPTKVIFGKDTESRIGELILAEKCRKVLVHFGGQSAKKSGLLDRICSSLEKAGIEYVTLGGVKPNPRVSLVREGIELCKHENVDFILAVGGGSVIDSAKAIGYGIYNDCDVWDIYLKKATPTGCAPIGVVLTISAAGSEMSSSSVISNDEGKFKRGYSSDFSRPRFAVMNPELTYTLPPYQTYCGCTDILMHTMERYFAKSENLEITDSIAEALMRTVISASRVLLENTNDYSARADVMWSGSLSHNDITGSKSNGDWATHQLGHELSAMFDAAHGAALAALWGSWARYVYEANPARFERFAVNVMCIDKKSSDSETALAGITAFEDFLREISMPTSISELDIQLTDKQINELAWRCTYMGKRKIGGFKALDESDMIKIYTAAR